MNFGGGHLPTLRRNVVSVDTISSFPPRCTLIYQMLFIYGRGKVVVRKISHQIWVIFANTTLAIKRQGIVQCTHMQSIHNVSVIGATWGIICWLFGRVWCVCCGVSIFDFIQHSSVLIYRSFSIGVCPTYSTHMFCNLIR